MLTGYAVSVSKGRSLMNMKRNQVLEKEGTSRAIQGLYDSADADWRFWALMLKITFAIERRMEVKTSDIGE